MPSIRDVSVHVVDSHGIQLEEWGIQHLRTSKTQDKVSAYIKSETDVAFSIAIEAKIPYNDYGAMPSSSEDRANNRSRYNLRDSRRRRTDSWDGSASRDHRNRNSTQRGSAFQSSIMSDRRPKSGSSPLHLHTTAPSPPPFDLLATLYLDGRECPERRIIIYLDPSYEDFMPGPGGVGARGLMKSRWVKGKDGNIYEHLWVFKNIGIETILDKMALTASNDILDNDEDALADALGRSGISHENDLQREESQKAGQIEVRIKRITLGEKSNDRHFRPKHREGEDNDMDMEGVGSDITHHTGFARNRTLDSRSVPVITYEAYRGEEKPFAIFKFFYRSQETLEKFHFPGFRNRQTKAVRSRNYVDLTLNNITPLSISNARPSTSKSKKHETEVSFEDQIRKGSFKKGVTPSYNFDERNRRLVSAQAEESSHSDSIAPLHNSQRRVGSRSIKVESRDETDKVYALPDYKSSTAAAQPSTPLISSAAGDENMLVKIGHKALSKPSDNQTHLALSSTGRNILRASTLDANDSCYGSADTASPRSGNGRTSSDTNTSISPGPNIDNKTTAYTSTVPPVLSSFSASKSRLREESSSDADDEQGLASDNETCGSESDMEFDDDDGVTQDKDDQGLHTQITMRMKLGKRQREVDEESEGGEVEESKKYNTEEEMSAADGVGSDLATTDMSRKTPGKRAKFASGAHLTEVQ